jgi:hypothetical protein
MHILYVEHYFMCHCQLTDIAILSASELTAEKFNVAGMYVMNRNVSQNCMYFAFRCLQIETRRKVN